MKRTPFHRTNPLLRRTPLRRRSQKMERLYQIRRTLVERFLREHPLCQRCLMARSTDPHELIPRDRGGSIINEENLAAICRDCHSWIHGHPLQATSEGWLRRAFLRGADVRQGEAGRVRWFP